MTTPREFTMYFNFKLVYTDIVYRIEISSHETIYNLFDIASKKFEPHIDHFKYYNDYVIAGQNERELAAAIGINNFDHPLWYEFGEKWKQICFYVRPVSRESGTFIRRDRYNENLPLHIEVQNPEIINTQTDTLGVILPSPPSLTINIDRTIFI